MSAPSRLKRYPRFNCAHCPQRFARIRERKAHLLRTHGIKPTLPKPGQYGSRFTPAEKILAEIAKRQRLVVVKGKSHIRGPIASQLAESVGISERAMRFRIEDLEERGWVKWERWLGCIVTQRGFARLQRSK